MFIIYKKKIIMQPFKASMVKFHDARQIYEELSVNKFSKL